MKTQTKRLLLIISLLLVGCENNIVKQDSRISNDISISKTEDFNDFRKRFYSDSIFQMSRIVFPLEGACNTCYDEFDILDQADTNADYFYIKDHVFYWKKEEWMFISKFKDKEFQMDEYKFKTAISGNDNTREERITNKNIYISNGFILEYKLIDNKWHLTYFDAYSY